MEFEKTIAGRGVVCFDGEIYNSDDENTLKENIRRAVRQLLDEGYLYFIDSRANQYCKLVAQVLFEEKANNSNMQIVRVIRRRFECRLVDRLAYFGVLYPNREGYYPENGLDFTDKWVVNHSDVIVCHVIWHALNIFYPKTAYAKIKRLKMVPV